MATLVLTGGRVVDPASGTDMVADVVIDHDRIAAVGRDAAATAPGSKAVDCRGLVVTPGLIDLHAHVLTGLGNFCVEPDTAGVHQGVPIVVDGGTSGTATFDISRRAIIDHPMTQTKILAFVDPNALYLATKDFIAHKLHIADNVANLDLDELAACVARNDDVIVGCKVRAVHVGDTGYSPFLDGAQRVIPDKPVMVHLGRFPHTPVITTNALLAAMRPGDIITHAFRGAGGMLGADGLATPAFRDAVERGLVLDVGHSGTDFRFREARRLFDQGYVPTTASTDLNLFNVDGPVFTLAETLTKLLALGLGLADVIAMATVNTARVIKRPEFGVLRAGAPAEVSVLRLRDDGPFPVSDGFEVVASPVALESMGCVRAGRWLPVPAALPSYATRGKTWGEPLDDSGW